MKLAEIEKRSTIRKVSVVCPFYNEESIIKDSVELLIRNLEKLESDWELILVNDGSTDRGLQKVLEASANNDNVKAISYEINQGRGYALRNGIDAAQGDIIVTNEIDMSWGEDIVRMIINKFKESPDLDVVIASPNLKGGGYKNIPYRRVLLSRLGNQVIRLLFTRKITMNTGMARGYRREVIQGVRTEEKGKEFHLEVLLKLDALGYRIEEIPAILEWRNNILLSRNDSRDAQFKALKLISSHLNFAVFANPIRYFWIFSLLCFLGAAGFLVAAFYRFIFGLVAIYTGLVGLFLGIFGLLFFGFGILTAQNKKILIEFWRKNI